MTISRQLVRGFRWSGFASIGLAVLAYLQLALLVRWLDKADFAEYALAAVFVNLGFQLQEGGLNAFIIQEKSITPVHLSTLFWLNLMFSLSLLLLSWPLANILVAFYELPNLKQTMLLLALLFPCNAFRLQYKTLLQKALRFKALSVAETAAALGGIVTAVWLAYAGFGVGALIGGYAIRLLLEAIFYSIQGWRDFRPALLFTWRGLQAPLRLATAHWSERLVTHLVYQIDILLIGKWMGPELLGVYDVFKRVLIRPANLLASAVERVSYPVMARLAGRVSRLQGFYGRTVNVMISLLLLGYVPLLLSARWVMAWYFGPDWLIYLPVFQIMIGLSLLLAMIQLTDSYFLVLRKIQWWMWAGLVLALLWTAGIALGREAGLAGTVHNLLYVQSFFSMLLVPLLIWKTGKKTIQFAYFLLPVVLAGLPAWSIWWLTEDLTEPFWSIIAVLVFLLLYGSAQFLFNRKTVRIVLGLVLK